MGNDQSVDLACTHAVIATTLDMTMERALEVINASATLTPLAADEIAVFRMALSNQQIDHYQTRMSESTLRNYERDFSEGRAVLNSHRAGGWFAGELPLGRTFLAELTGTPLPPDAPYEAVGDMSLGVYFYLQRGLKLTDIGTDDVIRGIEGGTLRDVSVGFTMAPDGWYRCSICGADMMDWGGKCSHLPGVTYDDGRAFAWVENARGREASVVYLGATPESFIDKAIRMVGAGNLSRRAAVMLEEQWGARILLDRTFPSLPVKREFTTSANPVVDVNAAQAEKGLDGVEWTELTQKLRAVDAPLADRLAPLDDGARSTALVDVFREQREAITALTPRAERGDQWLKSLVDEAVAGRVRAEGVGKFDAERYRTVLLATNDPDYIRAEIATWQRVSQQVFGDGGRPTRSGGVEPRRVDRPVRR